MPFLPFCSRLAIGMALALSVMPIALADNCEDLILELHTELFLDLGMSNFVIPTQNIIAASTLVSETNTALIQNDCPQTMVLHLQTGSLTTENNTIELEDLLTPDGLIDGYNDALPEIAHHEDHLDESIALSADDPGVLILRNATTIRNAANGAVNNFNTHQNYGPDGNIYYDGNYFGGLIKADVVAFTNNQRSVQMMQYAHPNLSSFNTCFFTYDDKFEEARDQVSMWAVNGVEFSGCDFRMNWDATERGNTISPQRPRAIFSIDAGFSVVNDCNFDDFNYAIYAANTGLMQSKPITIESNESNKNSFNGNLVSIAVTNQFNLDINNCFIDPEMQGYSPIALKDGIYINGASQEVTIENNIILDGESASTRGIYFNNSTLVDNLIRENRIEGWNYGIYAQSNNNGTFLTCNEFESREIDLVVLGGYVTENGQQNLIKGSVNENQGSADNPAGNLFTEGTCNSAPYKHVHTWQNESFNYHYENPANNTRYEPLCDIYAEYTNEETNSPSDCSYNEGNTGGGGPGPYPGPRTRTSFDGKKQSLDTWKSLLDGGDTDGLLQDVTIAPQSTSTYDKLKAASPFVTEPNLRETAKGNMQNSNKFDVLLSNAPLRPTVMVDAHPHLSPAQYALLYIIMQQGNLSPLQALQQLIKQEEYAMNAILGTLLEEYWTEGNETEAFEVLDLEGSPLSQKRKMAWALQKGNWQQAQSIMDGWDTENTELAEFKTVQECNLKAYQMQPLQADEMEMLENVASSNNSNSAYACAILSHATGQIYCAPQAPLDEAFNESGKKQRLEVPIPDAKYLNPQLNVSPNPASNRVRISLPFATEGEIDCQLRLMDNKGKVIVNRSINANELYLDIDLSSFDNGLYHVQLLLQNIAVAHSKLVVTK